MSLTPKGRQALKAKAHSLKPIVMVGNQGVSPAVIKEIDRALTDHELIKIRVSAFDREDKKAMVNEIIAAVNAELVQLIGNIGVLYRRKG
jgi:RNA-binding protein